jgi:exo-beta-1,3-glucanase (GH17 family)
VVSFSYPLAYTVPLTPPQLDAIRQTKVNVQVFLGNYILPNDDAVYERQKAILLDALRTYGVDHVAGITGRSDSLILK